MTTDFHSSDLPQSLPECHDKIRDLEAELAWFRRHYFGTKSERLRPALSGQLDAFGQEETKADPQEKSEEDSRPAERRRDKHGRRDLATSELPILKRVFHDVASEEKVCACCKGEKRQLPPKVSYQVGYRLPQLYRIEHVYAQYGCVTCDEAHISTASRPLETVERCMADPSLLAAVAVSKYADHLPLHRQEMIFRRQGLGLSRSTLCGWLMELGKQLGVLVQQMTVRIVSGRHAHLDETKVSVLARDHCKSGYFWGVVGGRDAPYTVYFFTPGRGRAGPEQFLEGFRGIVQSDDYEVYASLSRLWKLVWAGCWAHARRKFMDAYKLLHSSVAREALERIAELYKVERAAKDLSEEERVALRRQKSKPLLDELFEWMEEKQMTLLPKNPVAEALHYAVSNRKQLSVYIEHGYVGIDNNPVERALRPVVVGRRNWLFCGSEGGAKTAAVFFSLIESAKRHGLNVSEYLENVIRRLASHPVKRLYELLPDNWKPQPVAVA